MSFEVSGRPPRPPHVPIPTGSYLGVVCQIIDLGTHPNPFDAAKPVTRRASISFQLEATPITYTKDGETFSRKPWVSLEVGCILGSPKYPSTLRDIVEACLGSAPSDPRASVDITKLIGKACSVKLAHSEPRKDGSVWEKVSQVSALVGKVEAPALEIPPRLYLTDEGSGFVMPPEWVPGYLAAKIMASPEARASGSSRSSLSAEEVPF